MGISVEFKKKCTIKLPSLPDFIEEDKENGAIWDVKDMTNDELQTIGELWMRHLIMHAENRRKKELI